MVACVILLSLFAGCQDVPEAGFSDFVQSGDLLTLTRGEITVTVDPGTGMLRQVSAPYDSISMEGVLAEAGIEGEYLFAQLGYKDLSTLATYELPLIWPKLKELPEYTVDSITATEAGFDICISRSGCTFTYRYTLLENGISLELILSTTSQSPLSVNGVGFLVRGIEGFVLENATFEFPGSTPAGQLPFTSRTKYKVTASDYAAPVVQITDGNKTSNILYVNDTEKWTTGCYFDSNGRLCTAFLAATEGYLSAEQPMTVGKLYLPLRQPDTDPYLAVSKFWAQLGYHTPTDTTSTQELYAVYSGHPYGTMDTNYFNQWTLAEYAQQLEGIADMGFDAVWLLPVFQHTGDNVYEPIDAGIIDKRYGGLAEAKTYIDTAHALGVKVLFDFVPHGPRPVYPFAKEHDDWCSKDKQGKNQIEWECVSMDYNHPEYAKYNRDLAAYYASTIGLDGGRIDCSMGGLPNWNSAAGLRASAAGIRAGIHVVKNLRQGFLDAGAQVLLLPENFHPIPTYAEFTDVFYDMPLYRCMHNLNNRGLTESEYVSALTQFLNAQSKTSVEGQLKLRFLGNHDTVTWTFDAARAQTVYGTQRAKALWMVLGWIDGVLYIYQGDEDPATYHLTGQNLTDFFTQLIDAKSEYLPTHYRTEYISTGTPVMAFYRVGRENEPKRLVLVNLSDSQQSYPLQGSAEPLASIGEYGLSTDTVTLEPYAGVILHCSE